MIEAFFKTLKHYYLYRTHIQNFDKLHEVVTFAIKDYNHRPHAAQKGATPHQIFHNSYVPPDKDRLNSARQIRIEENKRKCCQA